MSHHPIATCTTLCVALASCSVLAQQPAQSAPSKQPSFGSEITVTATGVESEAEEVPVATTVVTRQQMDDLNSPTAADLLRRVPGLTVAASGADGSLTSVFTRGTNSNHTLVLLDGVRLSSPYFGGFDWSLPTTTALQRIEVVRGPFSALWGSDAIGGVVNLIPQRRRSGFGGRLLAENGQESWRRYEASAGVSGGGFDILASGYRRSGDGHLENGDFDGRQGLVTAGFSWGAADASRIGIVYQDLRSEIGIPWVTPGSPTPQRRQDATQRVFAVPLTWAVGSKWTVEVVASRVQRTIDFTDPDDPWGYVYSTTDADTDQARLASHHTLGKHTISWGGEWREDAVTDESPFGVSLDDVSETTVGVFVQDNWQIHRKLRLLLGVRWDETDSWGSEITGRLDFGWRLADSFELRGGVGQGFRAPALGELYAPFGGNPELEPETSESGEIGVVYTPLDGVSRWQLNLFATDIDNLIEYDFVGMENRNIGRARIKGAELVWEQGALDVLRWYLQATYLDTEDEDGLKLLRRPKYSLAWTLNGSLGRRWSGDATVLWVHSRDDVDPMSFDRVENESFYTVNLSLIWQPWSALAVTGRALNLFDREYQEVLGYPAPGRRFMFGLRWDF